MDLPNLQEKGQKLVAQITHTLEKKGKQIKQEVADVTQDKAAYLSEEAITAAVDRAVNVIQIASRKVIEKDIPTENVSLEVSVKVMGLVELKVKADVPKPEEWPTQPVEVKSKEKTEN